MVKKMIINFDLSKAPGPDCTPPMVVLKNCKPKRSYILAEHFSKSLKEFFFPNWWNVLPAVSMFKNIGELFTATNCSSKDLVKSLRIL